MEFTTSLFVNVANNGDYSMDAPTKGYWGRDFRDKETACKLDNMEYGRIWVILPSSYAGIGVWRGLDDGIVLGNNSCMRGIAYAFIWKENTNKKSIIIRNNCYWRIHNAGSQYYK